MLGTKFAGALDRIFEVVSRLNRISEKDLEDLEKTPQPPLETPRLQALPKARRCSSG